VVLRDPSLIARELNNKLTRKSPIAAVPSAPPEPPLGDDAPAPGTPILEQVTKAKQQAEAEAILAALNTTRWNRKQAASLLKIDYKALLYKMKKLNLEDNVISLPGPVKETRIKAATGSRQ